MRRFIAWLSGELPPSVRHRSLAPARRALRLALEPLECRELLTVAVTPVYTVTNSWTSGYQADLRLESQQAATISPWKLEFDLPANITSIWNATISSKVGNHYTIVGANWNNAIAGNGNVNFGFVANGSSTTKPANYVLNGESLGGTPAPTVPTLSVSDVSITEGNTGSASAVFTVGLSASSTSTITVKYATTAGTAASPGDYTATNGTLTFAPGQTSKTITVNVAGDSAVEADEAFYVDLSAPSGATLSRSRGTGTIKNDDVAPTPPASGDFQFQVTSDWGSGFTAQLTMRNTAATSLANWKLEFDFAGNITQIWDATIVSRTGNHYVVQNAGYNSTIGAGATMSFGFNGTRSSASVAPANFVLTGTAGTPGGGTPGGGTPGGNQTPVAAADFAFTAPGKALSINVLANDTDAEADALSVVSTTAAAHGAVVLGTGSTIQYTPQAGFTGTDTFTYQLRDARGATATGTVTVTVANPSVWPAHVFAPYVDMGLYPMYDLVNAAQTQGIKYFSLAFIVADPTNKPAWGGYAEYGLGTSYDAQLKTQLAQLRTLGGDVVVSFGGAANFELAEKITDVAALQRAYQSVIDNYGLSHIDFDIEGAAVADRTSVDRRNQAIAGLQRDAAAAGRVLDVSYTLPVLPTGLTADGLYVLQSALRYGVNLGNVNVMAMDYGDSAAPNPNGKMGDYAIAAANSLFSQLKTLYGTAKTDAQLWQMVGVTPMIGLNDVTTEVFDQQEARELVAFAQQKGIGRIGMWSLNRDRQNASGKLNYVDNTSSSLLQTPYEFSKIFNAITG